MYFHDNDFARTNIPPTLKTLYKFRKTNEYSFDILCNNRLYLASPSEFNDIFDSKKKVDFSYNGKSIANHLFKEFRDDPKLANLNRQQLRKIVHETAKKNFKNGYDQREIEVFNRLRETTGIISFSETNDSQLLWAHYADDHKGFCLIFDVNKLIKSSEYIESDTRKYICPIQKVNYIKNPEPLYFWKEEIYKTFYRFFYEKTKEWEYEQEWRLTLPEDEKKFISLEENTITGVIFGYRADQKTVDQIRDKCKGYHIDYFKCVIDDNSKFRVVAF